MSDPFDPLRPKEPTFGKWLAEESRPVDEHLARRSTQDFGTADLPVERYTSKAFHDKEMALLWSRVWQMACHETDIPNIGDYVTYEIGHRSFVIVRTAETTIKAYLNACLHRGMQLVDGQGSTAAFACRFHGWTWNLDGSLRRIPEQWDFPQTIDRELCLPQAKVGLWGGFVFINPDADSEPFEDFLGELPDHFARAPMENRKIALHIARVLPANWKIAMEAFMESYHVSPTHPQIVPVNEYAETQYDIYGDNVSRLASISVSPAVPALKQMTDQEFADFVAQGTDREPIQLEEGQTYRQALAEQRRAEVGQVQGVPVDHLTDVEMIDAIEYFLFPNFMPWLGYGIPIVYRFRPNGDRHDSSIMEVYLLAPRDLSTPAPKAAPLEWIPEDALFSSHSGLGRLGPIFDQDLVNITGVWKGLRSTAAHGVILGRYQESRLRHYHARIDDFMGREGATPP